MAVVEDLAALPAALLEVKPTMLYSVPTLFKRCVCPPSFSPSLLLFHTLSVFHVRP